MKINTRSFTSAYDHSLRTVLLELDKNTYLMLPAKYKDKLNTSTEYYTLFSVFTHVRKQK